MSHWLYRLCIFFEIISLYSRNCEFLNKLDLTVNFVDVDELEESITHLQSRENLKDLYMMGNPSQSDWIGFASYVIARLPQLHTLDGTEITRSMRILALQKLSELEVSILNMYLNHCSLTANLYICMLRLSSVI